MPNLGYVSILNINGNELSIKDDALTEVVNEIIEAIGQNNEDISEHINDLNDKSFDRLIKITSVNESELLNIQDGLYKLQYIITSGEEPNITETLTNSAILIQSNDSQYILKNGDILSRSKENSIWSNWVSIMHEQIQVDWNQTVTTAKDYIKNKPNIIQADWNEESTTSPAYILNKPAVDIPLTNNEIDVIWNESFLGITTFFINNTEYQIEIDMTWYEWVNSNYNTDNYYIDGTYVYTEHDYEVCTNNYVRVQINQIIDVNVQYTDTSEETE